MSSNQPYVNAAPSADIAGTTVPESKRKFDRTHARPGRLSAVAWLQESRVFPVMLIALLTMTSSAQLAWSQGELLLAIMWCLLPVSIVAGLVFRGLRRVLAGMLCHWCRPVDVPPALRSASTRTLRPHRRAFALARARDTIP